MANRIFYAVEQVGFAKDGTTAFTALHGLQDAGMTCGFNIEPALELGQVSLYQAIENVPEVEMSLTKFLDGNTPIYLLGTPGSASTSLVGRSKPKCSVALSIFDDSQNSASGTPTAQIYCSGMYISSIEYSFPVEGNCEERVGMVGNHRQWLPGPTYTFSGAFNSNTDSPLAYAASGGIQKRWMVLFNTTGVNTLDANGQVNDPDCTILPTNIPGISSSGTNLQTGPGGSMACHIQNITCSANLGRDSIYELGKRLPYYRYVRFPVECTTTISVLSLLGDQVSATGPGVQSYGQNLTNQSIKVAVAEGLRVDMGTKNKLNNVSYQGANTGGDNCVVEFSYVNWNDMSISHPQDVYSPTLSTTPAGNWSNF